MDQLQPWPGLKDDAEFYTLLAKRAARVWTLILQFKVFAQESYGNNTLLVIIVAETRQLFLSQMSNTLQVLS